MSIEAALDEEAREVMALLRNKRQANPASSVSEGTASPGATRSPVRSMLDVGNHNASTSNEGSKKNTVSPGSPPSVRSMLDIDGASTQKPIASGSDSADKSKPSSNSIMRSRSDSTPLTPSFGPRPGRERPDPMADYKFTDIFTTNLGKPLPKRNTLGGKVPVADDRGRLHISLSTPTEGRSTSAGPSRQSRSPNRRVGWGNHGPNASGRVPGYAVLDDGTLVNINQAYRKLSDANLATSQGSLSQIPTRKRSNSIGEPGSGRLDKDYLIPDDEDEHGSSSDDGEADDVSDDGASRGRQLSDDTGGGTAKKDRGAPSLLAAAEEERKLSLMLSFIVSFVARLLPRSASSNIKAVRVMLTRLPNVGVQVATRQPQKYKSLLSDPRITVTGPSGEKTRSSKPSIHPSTEFDHSPGSEPRSAMASEEEREVSDIKRAQKLAFQMTPIISSSESCRAVRIIYRGEFDELQKTAEEDNRRLRKYLVATDLSEESNHALEWAVGTVLRDGDTLLAIYCMDDETGVYPGDDVLLPDDTKAHEEQAAAINAVASATKEASSSASAAAPMLSQLARASAFGFGSRSSSPAPDSRERVRERAEEERRRAVEDITERVTRLLRKTKLQVKVVVEVIHCRNPKHLITEVIDLVSPTLVILGSRGRSALKG